MTAATNRQAGYTVLEMVIVSLVLIPFFYLAYGSMDSLSDETLSATVLADAERKADQAAILIAHHLRHAPLEEIEITETVSGSVEHVDFQKRVLDPTTGEVSLTGTFRVGFAVATDEAADALDNNKNGITDEGMLYLTYPDGSQQTLIGNVLPNSLWLELPAEGERDVLLRFQTAHPLAPVTTPYQGIAVGGVYPDQADYHIITVTRRLALRN